MAEGRAGGKLQSNPWTARRIIGFAHQGGALEAPPSTLAAMHRARDNGASALEFDLHLTSNDHLVLNHDPELTVDGRSLPIAGFTLEDLRALKPDLATAEEVLSEFPGVPITIEVKAREAAERAARLLAQEAGDRPAILTAFSPRTVAAVKRVAPRVDTAPGWPTILAFWLVSRCFGLAPPLGRRHVALQVALRFDQVSILKQIPGIRRLRLTDARFVDAAHRRGLVVHVWTLNDEDEIVQALDAGADGVFTDRPSVLTAVLRARGVYWPPDPAH